LCSEEYPRKALAVRRGELMGSGGRDVWVAGASEDQEVGVGGGGAEKGKVGQGVEIALVGRRLRGRWQHEGSQSSSGLDRKPGTTEST
jgi:hypothetical protein